MHVLSKAVDKTPERVVREAKDRVESYKLGVNAYVVKPVDFYEFMKAAKDIGAFWAVINKRTSSGEHSENEKS